MIRTIKESEIVMASQFAYKLNAIPKFNVKSFPRDYEEILGAFTRSLKREDSYLLGYFGDEQLEGLVLFSAETEDKYVQTSGGIFAESDFDKIANAFYDWIEEKFKGYYFYMAYSQENEQAIKFCESRKMTCCSRAYFLRIKKEDFRVNKVNTKIEELTVQYHDQFSKLHDVIGEGAFWNSKKIIEQNQFDVYLALQDDEVLGEFVVRKSLPEGEVYFLGVKEGVKEEIMSDLIIHATAIRLSKGIDTMAYVEVNSIVELNQYFKLGYHISETSIGYEIDKL